MPLSVYWGKLGMHFWIGVSFAYLFTVLESIRYALAGADIAEIRLHNGRPATLAPQKFQLSMQPLFFFFFLSPEVASFGIFFSTLVFFYAGFFLCSAHMLVSSRPYWFSDLKVSSLFFRSESWLDVNVATVLSTWVSTSARASPPTTPPSSASVKPSHHLVIISLNLVVDAIIRAITSKMLLSQLQIWSREP
ncbi:hypothetical protein PIB30_012013 [Stylosanthes scabra]|uniref:Protein TIC 20 n=1 Tax=Stylosanthes scabra TaxID=79078 RepID=A0ABU6Y2R5_9FABA|nr:hypothetical protein [Stylosanthes scabra]